MTKGLKIKLIISKKKTPILDSDCGEDSNGAEILTNSVTQKLDELEIENNNDDDEQIYQTEVESGGKFSRKATWDDLCRFTGEEINPDVLRDWILQYQEKCYPEGMFCVCVCACVCVCWKYMHVM
jgi:hypothetical protein